MTFREAMDGLKAKYNNTVSLSLMTSVREDGSEYDFICAHAYCECGSGSTYEDALADLAYKIKLAASEMAAQDRAEAQYQDAKDRGERI